MSLEDKFQAHVGDLVVFTSEVNKKVDLVGYVRDYSVKKVELTNRAPHFSAGGEKRDMGWWPALVDEKRYSVNLSLWNDYKILREANTQRE